MNVLTCQCFVNNHQVLKHSKSDLTLLGLGSSAGGASGRAGSGSGTGSGGAGTSGSASGSWETMSGEGARSGSTSASEETDFGLSPRIEVLKSDLLCFIPANLHGRRALFHG